MRHLELFELHDHPRFPGFLRDLITDALQAIWDFGNSYKPVLPLLRRAMERTTTREILDLCSGGGGPWFRLVREMEDEHKFPVQVRLSDKYPNHEAFEKASARSGSRIGYAPQAVEATAVPRDLAGFRTMFSSFHHFGSADARRVLADAVERRRGIAIFETARREPKIMLTILLLPLLILLLTPGIRPFRWSRLLWTYLLPVVPLVLLFDGWMSCLRAYSQEELREMVRGLAAENYRWELGTEESGFLPVTYLVGTPLARR